MTSFIFSRIVSKSCVGLQRLRSFSTTSCSPPHISADAITRNNNSLLINHGREIVSTTFIPIDGGQYATKGIKNLSFPMEGPLFVSGPCNGQYCVYSNWNMVCLFNPATGDVRSFTFPLQPRDFQYAEVRSIGLGFDSKTNGFKIVRSIICNFWNHRDGAYDLSYRGKQHHYIEIFSLGSMIRKEIPVLGEIRSRIPSLSSVPNVDGVCYWSVKDSHYQKMKVISFNFADEVFDVITLPPCDYPNYNPETEDCVMEVFNGLPAAIRYDANPDKYFEVWVKREAWVKDICIGPISDVIKPLCFWKNCGLVLQDSKCELVLYDFVTKQVNKLNIQLAMPVENEDERIQPIIQVLNLPWLSKS